MINPELYQLEKVTDPVLRSQIISTLYTRISSGLELGENKPSDLGMKSPSDAWAKANEYLIDVAQKDHQEGFGLAMALVEIPLSEDVKQENLNRWMRTSGLMLLGLDELKEDFAEFLNNDPNSVHLANTLKDLMNTDISDLTTSRDFDGNPTGYSTVQSVYICLGLENGKSKIVSDLYNEAIRRRSDSDVKTAFGVVSSFSDCVYLKSRFL